MLRKVFLPLVLLVAPILASAHEAYVMPRATFWTAMRARSGTDVWSALASAHNLGITLWVIVGVLVLLAVNALFRRSALGQRFHGFLDRHARAGLVFVRVAIAVALFFSAAQWSFLGPELPIGQMPAPVLLRLMLFGMSIMIGFGVYTDFAGLLGSLVFLFGFATFGSYLFSYANYLGELVALALFGSRSFSVDALLGRISQRLKFWPQYETTIVRVSYGFVLLYAAVTIKFMHADITLRVISDWHLTQFHWLFPSDPLFLTLGAGIAEAVIGLFIMIGFELRLTVLVSLFYITLSLLYFREQVWPHVLLYGISLMLLTQPETLTIDNILTRTFYAGTTARA